MSATSSRIAIAGGGIGGLAAALALSKQAIASAVYERRPAFPEEGAGIQIGPNGTRILQRLGIAERLEARVAKPDILSVRDGRTGRTLAHLPLGGWIEARHGSPYWTAHRKDLHSALRERASADPLIELQTGVEIVSFSNNAAGIHALDASGKSIEATALICADGLWSTLRNAIVPQAKPRAFGKAAFRSVTSATALPAELTPNAVHIWLAPGAHVVHYPVNAGRDIALVIIADDPFDDPDWSSSASSDIVRGKARELAPPLQSLISEASDWRCWPLYTMPPLARWTSGRAALLGDAAHPVLPFLAQGAVMALEDAVTLATHLSDQSKTVEAALQTFEQTRHQRVRRVADASLRNGRIYHMTGASALARNAAMSVMPPERIMAGFDWLYGWRL